ncbi:MAG TPA: ABC transporter permease [Chryseolinea sp.]|nr:ABC transporter permease [Chryseolinea sp.]
MISNYLKIMIRNMVKHKLYSVITILGLTTGIAFALLIGIFTWTEMQVNQSLVAVDRLYKLETKYKDNNGNPLFAPIPLAPRAKQLYPGKIENVYSFLDRNITVSKGDKHFRLQSMIGDSTFIQIFGFRVLSGDPLHALSRPYSIVITESVAQQFFNRTDVAGETLEIASEGGGLKNYEVTAVIAEPEKKNSVTDLVNMDAKVFLSLVNASEFSLGTPNVDDWQTPIITYIKLHPATSATEATKLLNEIIHDHAPLAVSSTQLIELAPLTDYYRLTNNGAVQNLLVSLSIIVIFILLLAIANFINITISGSFSRLKETGVRKVIGGLKNQVVFQFITESVMYAVISGLLGVLLYELFKSYFGLVLATELPSVVQLPVSFWIVTLLSVIAIGVIAGVYPSIYLSTTHTIESLKGKFKSVSATINFSRILISIQFLLSIFILIGAVIMSGQINYFLEKDLGYDKNAVLVVTSAPRLWTVDGFEKMETAKHELMRCPAISAVSLSTGSPSSQLNMGDDVVYRAGHSPEEGVSAALTGTDEDFATVYEMKIIEGKYFNANGGSLIPFSVVINESAQKALSVQLNDKVKLQGGGDQEYQVIGILKDFNFETLHQAIRPVVIMHSREFMSFRFYSIKLNPGDIAQRVQEIERAWHKAFPNDAFVSSFADERIQQRYKTELQLKKAATLASVLMLVIVMTGVLGLVALSVAKRTKEIGIRKVLGASASQILGLIGREYAIVMAVSFAIGIPLSYAFINQWLSTFVYHISLKWWMFILPPAFVFGITLCIVAVQGISAALANPVKSLKYE